MVYTKQTWANAPATSSPLNDTRLQHIEDGLEAAAAIADNALATLNFQTLEWFQDRVADMLRPGTNVSMVYDDAGGGLLTISATGGGGGGGSVTIAGITDATAIGKLLLGAADEAAGRSAINAQVVGDYATNGALPTAIDARILTQKGTPNGLASIGSDGKLLSSQVPELAIARPFPAASQAAMLALDAQVGDIAIRSDISQNFILRFEPATSLSNWLALAGGAGAVTSVAGRAGAITLVVADISDSGSFGRSLLSTVSAQSAQALLTTSSTALEWHTTTGGVAYGTPDPNGTYAPHPITSARLRYTNPLKEPTWDGNRVSGGGGADATRYPYDIWEGP